MSNRNKNKILLIGNGININANLSWEDLINKILDNLGIRGQINNSKSKPFPLLYEEICVEAIENRNYTEYEIKKIIGEETRKLQPNDLHTKFLNLGIKHILTTNYDHTFEKVLSPDENFHSKNDGLVKEKSYNIFRKNEFQSNTIWHIHGDADYPQSITLGYEHYSGYLQNMRNYIVTGNFNYENFKSKSIFQKIRNHVNLNEHSWLDLFFLYDVHIVGLTLDVIEIHLWWLLTIRKRAKLTKELNITNEIYYYYPSNYANSIVEKLQLMKSFGIICVSCPIDENNKEFYYEQVIKKIEEQRY